MSDERDLDVSPLPDARSQYFARLVHKESKRSEKKGDPGPGFGCIILIAAAVYGSYLLADWIRT